MEVKEEVGSLKSDVFKILNFASKRPILIGGEILNNYITKFPELYSNTKTMPSAANTEPGRLEHTCAESLYSI